MGTGWPGMRVGRPLRGRGPVVWGCPLAHAWVPLKTKPPTLGTSRAGPGSVSFRGPCTWPNQPPPGSQGAQSPTQAVRAGRDASQSVAGTGQVRTARWASGVWPAGAPLLPWPPFPHLCKDPWGSRETQPPWAPTSGRLDGWGPQERRRWRTEMGNGWGRSAAQPAAHLPPTPDRRLGDLAPTRPAGRWTQTWAFGPLSSRPCVY